MTFTDAALLASEEAEKNPLLPNLNEIVWGGLCFVILLVLFWKYVLPQARQALTERTTGIEGKLEQAERDRAEAEALLAQYRTQLAEANLEAARLRAEAQAERTAIVDAARGEATDAAALVKSQADASIEASRSRTKADLSREVGQLALDLAGKVVGESLTDDQRAKAVVDRFIAELETAAPAGSA